MTRTLKDPGKEHNATAPLTDGGRGEEIMVGAVRFQGWHEPGGPGSPPRLTSTRPSLQRRHCCEKHDRSY